MKYFHPFVLLVEEWDINLKTLNLQGNKVRKDSKNSKEMNCLMDNAYRLLLFRRLLRNKGSKNQALENVIRSYSMFHIARVVAVLRT